jgi:hypothetical protein
LFNGNESKEKIINDLIKNEVEEPLNMYGDGTLTMNWNYQVSMSTPELLSVSYTCDSKIEGATFPTKDIYIITIRAMAKDFPLIIINYIRDNNVTGE